jgi:outer membrane protein
MSSREWISLLLLLASAPAAYGEDLLEIYRQAVQNDARWGAAQHAEAAGLEKLPQGRAGLFPTLNLSGSHNNNDASVHYQQPSPFVSGQRNYVAYERSANLTQPLIRLQNIAQYRQSISQAELATIQLETARNELILRVAQTYIDALFAQDSLTLATGQITSYRSEYEQAQARLTSGAAPITDVYETRARLELAIAQEIAARHDLEVKHQSLQRLTGSVPGTLAPLRADFKPKGGDPESLQFWLDRSEQKNPQLRAQRLAVTIAEREVDKARAAHLPTVDAVASYSINNSTASIYVPTASEVKLMSAGIQVQWPVFQGGLTTSRQREAVELREKAVQELEDTKRAVALQVRQAYLAVVNSFSQIQALEQAVISNETLVDATRFSRRSGLKTQTDVLNTEQQLLTAKRDLARARYQYILAQLQLKAEADVLEEGDILKANAWLASGYSPSSVAKP